MRTSGFQDEEGLEDVGIGGVSDLLAMLSACSVVFARF